jgi:hypothetical protein
MEENNVYERIMKDYTIYFKNLEARELTMKKDTEKSDIELTGIVSKIIEILNCHPFNTHYSRYEIHDDTVIIYDLSNYSYLYEAAIYKLLPKWMD